MTASKRFIEITEQMKDIYIRKNAGYSGDCEDPWVNFRKAELFGVSAFKGCMIRASDKFNRIANLIKNPNNDQVGESVKDNLVDLANYVVIALCLYEEEEEKFRKENINEGTVSTSETRLEDGNEYFTSKVFRRGGDEMG
jgi:hypothetical protein